MSHCSRELRIFVVDVAAPGGAHFMQHSGGEEENRSEATEDQHEEAILELIGSEAWVFDGQPALHKDGHHDRRIVGQSLDIVNRSRDQNDTSSQGKDKAWRLDDGLVQQRSEKFTPG